MRLIAIKFFHRLTALVKTVNYIKKNALKSRCFAALCERLDADNLQLLYHSDIRWLSRGCVLNRLFELRKEVHKFLEEQRSHLAEHYTDYQFCAKLAYLSDIFDQLNQLNVSMQGRNSTVFMVSDKIEGFKKNSFFGIEESRRDDLTCFHIWVKLWKPLLMWTYQVS